MPARLREISRPRSCRPAVHVPPPCTPHPRPARAARRLPSLTSPAAGYLPDETGIRPQRRIPGRSTWRQDHAAARRADASGVVGAGQCMVDRVALRVTAPSRAHARKRGDATGAKARATGAKARATGPSNRSQGPSNRSERGAIAIQLPFFLIRRPFISILCGSQNRSLETMAERNKCAIPCNCLIESQLACGVLALYMPTACARLRFTCALRAGRLRVGCDPVGPPA